MKFRSRANDIDGDPADSARAARPADSPGAAQPAEPLLLGVSARLAEQTGFSVSSIRGAFVILGAAGGIGIGVYLVMTTLIGRTSLPALRRSFEANAGLVVLATGTALWCCVWWPFASYPIVIAGVGVVAAISYGWRPIDVGSAATTRNIIARVAVGGALCAVGTVAALGSVDSFDIAGRILLWIVLAFVGAIILVAPSVVALSNAHRQEHDARVRESTRAAVAAHLHDSVLQTLTLIGRNPADAATVARLARRQERELRRWLYEGDEPTAETQWPVVLRTFADGVEDDYAVAVELITAGGGESTTATNAACAAAREAMVNAAKFSGQDRLSVFAEAADGVLSVFVRDRGVGFDPGAVSSCRRGIADSIIGRVASVGGTATVKSGTVGADMVAAASVAGSEQVGTEVTIVVPLEARPADIAVRDMWSPATQVSAHSVAGATSAVSAAV